MEIKTPQNEIAMVSYMNRSGSPVFLLTTKTARDYYYLYSIDETGRLTKLGKAHSPRELEDKFKVNEEILKQ